jgi:peptide/nickel transport system ATP-binding protein
MTRQPPQAATGRRPSDEAVLTLHELRVTYRTLRGPVHAVRGVSLAVPPARIFGLVGESGSGKSTVAQAAMGALRGRAHVQGEVRYRGTNLLDQPAGALRRLWGRRLAMVFQDPTSTLNPVLTVGEQLVEVLREHESLSTRQAEERARALFAAVRLPRPGDITRRYPHQLSGGQQQRVSIAIALACDPDVLILDEPTTGLDVTTEARILDLVESLRQRSRAAILYISHNLGVIHRLCDDVAVMYAGEVVEQGPARPLFARPRHPYTLALLECLPRVDAPPASRLLPAIEGSLPDPTGATDHCLFAPRCRMATERCRAEHPGWVATAPAHLSRCFYADAVPPPAGRAGGTVARPVTPPASRPLLEVDGILHHYRSGGGVLGWGAGVVRALDGVSLAVPVGQTLAVVGESGSGKTTLARAVVGLLRPTAGRIRLDGTTLPRRPGAWRRALRRRLQIVFQNPDLTLNPRRTILEAVARPLELFALTDRRRRRADAKRLLEAVGLGERYLDVLPSQISGGQRQRVAIARAFACRPDLVVCDEPTSALDVSVQATVLNLLAGLQAREHSSYLFISHDLSVVRHIADRVAVLYLGHVCEIGPTEDVFAPPYHPYTETLLDAVPSLSAGPGTTAPALEGPTPDPAAPPSGCPFHPRCPRKVGPICEVEAPPLAMAGQGHAIACHIPPDELRRLQARHPADPAPASLGGPRASAPGHPDPARPDRGH